MAENIILLSAAQKKFIDYLKSRNKASATILAYAKDVDQLNEFLTKKQITQIRSVLPEHLEEFKEYLSTNNYLNKSISRKLNSIRTFFRFLAEEYQLEKNPAEAVTHPKYETKPPRILSKIEYRALRDAVREDPRMSAIIELLLQTGMRISELARLEIKDINGKDIKIAAWESHLARTIPLNQAANKSIDRYLKLRPSSKSRHIFITKTGRPLLVRNIRTSVDRFFKMAGIEKATVNDLRHTFIVHQLMGGASVSYIQKLVGHKRSSTTEKYLELIKEEIKPSEKLEEL